MTDVDSAVESCSAVTTGFAAVCAPASADPCDEFHELL